MADKKPPRFDADERTILCALLQYQRESLVRKVDGVSEPAARQQFVGSGTTLLWLMKHMSWAEQLWFVGRFAGYEVALPDDEVSSSDTVETAIAVYRETWARTDAILRDAQLDDLCRATGDEVPTNLRWVLAHLLEETARHAGHADILRELVDGTTGR